MMWPSQPQQSSAFFDNIENVAIHGGNFQHNIHFGVSEPGLGLLRQAASLPAAHDSSDRDPPPRCAEGTRKKVIADIVNWINDPSPRESVLWLNGPFGNGKSAIMQTTAETLRNDPQMSHLLAGSFFFGRGKSGRDKAKYLVPTIAYQIATNIPWMRNPIESALVSDPTILSKSIEAQLRYLITEPFRRTLDQSTPFHTPTVIIDGLDECDGHDSQILILSVISTAIFKDHVKLRFLIASRPERQISKTFRTHPLHQLHLPITLVRDYETYKELEKHMRSGFDRIYERHSDLMFAVEKPWPSDEKLTVLAQRASGQFLYASTVLRFVDADDTHPVHQLELIFSKRSLAFSDMDELYTLILESSPRQELLSSVLCSMVYLHSAYVDIVDIRRLEAISGLQAEDILVVLRGLPAVTAVETPNEHEVPESFPWHDFMRYYSPIVSFHHQSFIEFLTDKERAGRFFVDKDIGHGKMTAHLDELVAECLTRSEPSTRRVYRYTWDLISHMLLRDPDLLHWPRLRKILDDIEEYRDPFPSKLTNHFFNVFSSLCNILKDNGALKRLFDVTYLKCFPMLTTPTMWKIAGVLSIDDRRTDIHTLSKETGLSIQTILQTLEKSHHFFDVEGYRDDDRSQLDGLYKWNIEINWIVKRFLLDESHSRILYFAYRSSVIRAVRSKLVGHLESLKSGSKSIPCDHLEELGVVFKRIAGEYGWDIRIGMDMQEGSPMRDVIDLLHAYLSGHDSSATFCEVNNGLLFQWFCRQFHIVKATSRHASTAGKLQDIINLTKDVAMSSYFIQSLHSLLTRHKLPPFGIKAYSWLGRFKIDHWLQPHTCYLETKFLWNKMGSGGISAAGHIAIIKYYMLVLLASMVDRNLSNENRNVPVKQTGEVNWECHLLNTPASSSILQHLLTFHYIFTRRTDLICVTVNEALGWLPLSFVKASLAWFRRCHYRVTDSDLVYLHDPYDRNEEHRDEDYRGQGFETWCEHVIAAKENATIFFPSPAFANPSYWPSSNNYNPWAPNHNTDTD